ncbi:MAG: DASS family sodium-coupled anion symporter [Halieaceae bacterium]
MRDKLMLAGSFCLGAAIWMSPTPDGVVEDAWRLFAIFISTILAVISGGAGILLASILALVIAVLSGTLEPTTAYSGFSQGFILLIVVAFLVGRGVVNSGLGSRIGYLLVRSFGKSSLGLAYSMVATDALIAPAFPSNTARSGVLYPIVYALAENNGSHPWEESRRRIGAYLMMCSMAGLGLSSALWLTAMAANPIGVALVARQGVEITFGSWLLASSVPTLCAMVLVPWCLYRWFPPELKQTPEAPAAAAAQLANLGAMSAKEWITLATFATMVIGWALSTPLGLDATAIAFLGLAVMMLSGIFTLADIKRSGDALETLIWFAILFTISSELDRLGFMQFLGDLLGGYVDGLSWPLTYLLLTLLYVLLHYLFVSQTAHLLALLGVFIGIAQPEVPLPLMAMTLLLATNFFSVLTPQASSCNVIFVGSGYITGPEVYRYGGLTTLLCLAIYLVIGAPWIYWVL